MESVGLQPFVTGAAAEHGVCKVHVCRGAYITASFFRMAE